MFDRNSKNKNITNFLGIFCCPFCKMKINFTEEGWECLNCKKKFPKDEDGVFLMRKENIFFGADQKKIIELLGKMRKISSYEELKKYILKFEKDYPDFNYDYCLNPQRADWTFLGDFNQKIVVDLGAGYGSCSLPLAKRATLVIAVDTCLERLKFLSIVAKLKNIFNVIPIQADTMNLPFKEETIDRFLMIGLLEYFSEKQDKILKYLYSLLKKEGELWIGIENRLSPIHFFGRSYHDGEFPFEHLFPRFFTNFLHRLMKGRASETKLYTKKGYFKLLNKSGFKDIKFYFAFPDYKNPRFISSSEKTKIISNYLKQRTFIKGGIKTRTISKFIEMLDKLNLAGFFAPCFFIKAKK